MVCYLLWLSNFFVFPYWWFLVCISQWKLKIGLISVLLVEDGENLVSVHTTNFTYFSFWYYIIFRWHSKRDFVFSRQWFRGQDGSYSESLFASNTSHYSSIGLDFYYLCVLIWNTVANVHNKLLRATPCTPPPPSSNCIPFCSLKWGAVRGKEGCNEQLSKLFHSNANHSECFQSFWLWLYSSFNDI